MKFFRRLIRSKIMTFLALVLLLACVFVFLFLSERELNLSQQDFLKVYMEQEDEYVNLLSNQLEIMTEEGVETDNLVEYINSELTATSSRWAFLCVDQYVVFARNPGTTKKLNELRDWIKFSTFLEQQQDVVISTASYTVMGEHYILGVVSSESTALYRANIPQHSTFLLMGSGIFAAVMFALLLVAMLVAKLRATKLMNLDQAIVAKNLQVQDLLAELSVKKEMRFDLQKPIFDQLNICDADMLRGFINKSGDPSLFPICFMGVYVIMDTKYYTKKQIFSYIEPVKELLSSRHILGEIGRGEFLAVLYKTDIEEAYSIRDKIYEAWETGNLEKGFRIGIGIVRADSQEQPIIEIFDNIIEKIKIISKQGQVEKKIEEVQ